MRRAGIAVVAVWWLASAVFARAAHGVGTPEGAGQARAWPQGLDRNRDGQVVVACLGDSNTSSRWQAGVVGGFPPESGWCELLEASLADPKLRSVNLGLGGATVAPNPLGGVADQGLFFGGGDQLASALDREPVDVVLLAFGTNDVQPDGSVPAEIVDHYNRLVRRVRSRGLVAFVATTPPVYPHRRTGQILRDRAKIRETNDRIRETFPPGVVLDFDTGYPVEEFLDHLHLNAAGHAHRARVAGAALERRARVLPEPVGVRALSYADGHWGPAAPRPTD